MFQHALEGLREAGGDAALFTIPLPSDIAQANAQLREELRYYSDDEGRRNYFLRRLQPAVAGLLRHGETPEGVTDMVISLVRRLPPKTQFITDFLNTAVPALFGLLHTQMRRDSGWSATVNALAILLSTRTSNPDVSLPQRIVLYHESVSNVADQGAFVAESIKTLDQAVTNLLASLSSLPARFRSQKRESWQKIYANLLPLSIALHLSQSEESVADGDLRNFKRAIVRLGWPMRDLEAGQFVTTLRVADAMSSASDSFGMERGSLERLLVYVLAGSSRALFRMENRVASSMFNAGVEVARFASTPGQDEVALAGVRGLFNALGLWWALELNSTLANALGEEGDGGDCAVNLLGSLVAMKASRPVAEVTALVAQIKAVDGNLDADQKQRIDGSIQRLGAVSVAAAAGADAQSLQAVALDIILTFVPENRRKEVRQAGITPANTLMIAQSVLQQSVKPDQWKEGWKRLCEDFTRAYQPFMQPLDLLAMLERNYGTYRQDGPLATEGVLSAEEWAAWVARTHQPFHAVEQIFAGLAR